jgi:hypothetical protein
VSTFMEHIHRDVTLFDAEALKLWTPVEYTPEQYPMLTNAYRHENGGITYVVIDEDGSHANPREDECNLTTLIQVNSHCIDVDTDDAGLSEAVDRWGRDSHHTIGRYIRMFRDDILYYDSWYAGESYGWGYITLARWREFMVFHDPSKWSPEEVQQHVTGDYGDAPRKQFDAEVKLYQQWCDGEVYGAIHVYPDRTQDSCWGFLGYDDQREIAAQFTSSPVTETLY